MRTPEKLKALLHNTLRPPKILILIPGDLRKFIVTLPLISSLKKQLPHAILYVCVPRHLEPLVTILPQIEGSIGDPGIFQHDRTASLTQREKKQHYEDILALIEAHNFDIAILPEKNSKLASLVRSAGIPWRVAESSFFHWRKYNLRLRPSSRFSAKVEYQRRLALLRPLGLKPLMEIPEVLLAKPAARNPIFVIEPVAETMEPVWPVENFVLWVTAQPGKKFIVVGLPHHTPLLQQHFGQLKNCRIETTLTLRQLAELIAASDFFCSNHSGLLHLAALLQIPHAGFYPQNKSSDSRRWRTLPVPGAPDTRDYLLQTDYDAGCLSCYREKCPYWPCTASVPIKLLDNAVRSWQNSRKEYLRRQQTLLQDEAKLRQELQNKLEQVLAGHEKNKRTSKQPAVQKKNKQNKQGKS